MRPRWAVVVIAVILVVAFVAALHSAPPVTLAPDVGDVQGR